MCYVVLRRPINFNPYNSHETYFQMLLKLLHVPATHLPGTQLNPQSPALLDPLDPSVISNVVTQLLLETICIIKKSVE